MNQKRFAELTEALQPAKAVRRGEAVPARVWNVTQGKDGPVSRRQLDPRSDQPDRRAAWENTVAATRVSLSWSQNKFAERLGISVKTLHHWEPGRRQPTGAARVRLRVVARHPEVILEPAVA